MATEQDIQALKQFTASLDAQQKEEFRTRFNGLDADAKDKVIQNIVLKQSNQNNVSNPQPVEQLKIQNPLSIAASGSVGIPSAIENLQSIMNRKSSVPESAISGSIGGIPAVAAGAKNMEKALPVAMGIAGTVAGSQIGKPNLGLGLGTGIGKLEEQAIGKLRGNGQDIDIPDVLITGGLAAAGGKIFDTALKSVGLSAKLIPEETRAAFFDKALQAVEVGKDKLGSVWRNSVNKLIEQYPNVRVDLSTPMKNLSNMIEGLGENIVPQLKSAVSRSPKLLEAVDNPEMAKDLTLSEAQELKNAITSTTNSITRNAIKGKTTPNERFVFDLLDNIDEAITSKFPQMSEIRKAYNEGKKAYEMARPLVEPGTAVESSIFSKPEGFFGLGGSPLFKSTQGRLATKKIMGMTEPGAKMFEAAKLAHNINRAADAVGRLSQIGVGGAVLKKIFKGGGKSYREG